MELVGPGAKGDSRPPRGVALCMVRLVVFGVCRWGQRAGAGTQAVCAGHVLVVCA